MHIRRGRCPGAPKLYLSLLPLLLAAQPRRAAALGAAEGDRSAIAPLEAVLAWVESRATAASGSDLLKALNATSGSTTDQLITLTGACGGSSTAHL